MACAARFAVAALVAGAACRAQQVGVSPPYGWMDGRGTISHFNLRSNSGFEHSLGSYAAGVFYVVDNGNAVVRAITSDGNVSLLAGGGYTVGKIVGLYADGVGTLATFNFPTAVCATADGATVYVSDTGNRLIRAIDVATRNVTTLAGRQGVTSWTDGVGSTATFKYPLGLAVDYSAGVLYVADKSARVIRAINISTGNVTTLVGTGQDGQGDGPASSATFSGPFGLAYGNGVLYISDGAIRSVRVAGLVAGNVSTITGAGGDCIDGSGTVARLKSPTGIALAAAGTTLYVADLTARNIRSISLTGGGFPVGILAGNACGNNRYGLANDIGTNAVFNSPEGVAATDDGRLLVVDLDNNVVRAVDTSGPPSVSTFAGGFVAVSGSVDGVGPASRFSLPFGVATCGDGALFVTDNLNHALRSVTVPDAVVTTPAGSGSCGKNDGPGTAASFCNPAGIVCKRRLVYIADTGNKVVRVFNATSGNVTTVAGNANAFAGFTDGIGTLAKFTTPTGLALDSDRALLYVGEKWNVRVVSLSDYSVSTVAGGSTLSRFGCLNGQGTNARLSNPYGLALNLNSSVLYIADASCGQVFAHDTTTRNVVAVAGKSEVVGWSPYYLGIWGQTDGTGSSALLGAPLGVAFQPPDTLVVVENYNYGVSEQPSYGWNVLRVLTVAGAAPAVVATLAGGGPAIQNGYSDGAGTNALFWRPSAAAFDSAGTLYVADSGNNLVRMSVNALASAAPVFTTLAGVAWVTPSGSPTASVSPTSSSSATPSGTMVSPSVTASSTLSASVSSSVTASPVSASSAASVSRSPSLSPSVTISPVSPSLSASASSSATTTLSESVSSSASVLETASLSPTSTSSMTAASSSTPSSSSSPSSPPSLSTSASLTLSLTSSPSSSPSSSLSASLTGSLTLSTSPSVTETMSLTSSPSSSPSASLTGSLTSSTSPSVTETLSLTSSPSSSLSSSLSASLTGSLTSTVTPSASQSATGTPSASFLPASVAYSANLSSPLGAANVSSPDASLPATLTGLRCDTATVAAVPLQQVRFTGGRRAGSSAGSSILAPAIATANAATSCPPARRALLASDDAALGAQSRSMQAVDAVPWATLDVLIGASTTAAGAAGIAAAVASAGSSAYPRTISAWAPTWGYTSAQWLASVGSPVAVGRGSINITNAVSFSPAPAGNNNSLTSSQQLGLGLGVAIALALAAALAVAAAVRMRAGASGGRAVQAREVAKAEVSAEAEAESAESKGAEAEGEEPKPV